MAGSDAVCGKAQLAFGEVTVSTTRVTASSIILLSHADFSAGTPGHVAEAPASRVAGVSFKIVGDAADGSYISWVLFN